MEQREMKLDMGAGIKARYVGTGDSGGSTTSSFFRSSSPSRCVVLYKGR